MTTKKKEIGKKVAANKPHGSATAAAILGRPVANHEVKVKKNGEVKIKQEWVKFYNRLLELRDQLTRQMNGLAKESAQEMAGYSLHMADSGTDNFDRDFALSLLSSDQDAVYEIEEALKRIETQHLRDLRIDRQAHPQEPARGNSLDPLYRTGPVPVGARWSAAPAALGRPGHR